MAKISDVYAGDFVSAGQLPNGQRITAVVQFAGIEQVGQEQQKRVVLTLAAPDGRPWPRRLVLNKTNAAILTDAYGDETTALIGRTIDIWKAPTRNPQGQMVDGVKVLPAAPANGATGIPGAAIPLPGPTHHAPGNGAVAAAGTPGADGYTAPLPSGMPTAPPAGNDLDDSIPF